MNHIEEIRKELSGKTGMEPSHEEDLFFRIDEVENNGGVVAPLTRIDWILSFVFIGVFGFIPLIWFAIKLF